MEYLTLTEEEKHDMMVQFLQAQERDHYWHNVNRDRYTAILADSSVNPTFRKRIQQLLNETEERIHEVTHLMDKTKAALPAEEHVEAAKMRLRNLAKQG